MPWSPFDDIGNLKAIYGPIDSKSNLSIDKLFYPDVLSMGPLTDFEVGLIFASFTIACKPFNI